ncbi:bifunctional biotin--[acetyl-CoA-carboxylase] ligase/biotin operon repressor BirA [Enterococcus sp. DIV0242_7C1]|uniref:Bifunctional ligase/repressor BirA n=1 Tax=Candidatus Enterococcus dunnyi TaxID=1834192 RepID=A0A200J6Y3_9ENTE|nr:MULTISPECIES: bifunctional biotin--[acetyl-CoA-carboxylase] ligase/biotin operon repressor BirA [unclassified Enterococcus]MBO0471446.1 bifunctional biotin--[acetyl-CoA-carboxylase] ligase/biotin operon repressor BirA [Enterococcus sp. DIV0242_7C1]OUZ32609.1 biotin-[acetyl-CoA-carboxylase] ligase [Enterococcus sp. 9D6_DIV0238]
MSTKSQVLTLLMKQAPTFISGEEMAQELSLSRTAIWKAINELKKEGHQISSSRNKGYRYDSSDILSAEGIKLALAPTTPDLSITILDSSESTMKDAKLAAINGEPDNTLIVADIQEAPKGRFGRPFFSKAGCGIYMSMLLRPNQRFEEMAQYTVIMAVAAARAMDELAHLTTEIKWVNDIYLNGKKIGGILSEAMSDVESGQISNVIIGMGINFSLKQNEFPEELQEKATSIFSDRTPTITRNELIAAIWNQFYRILAQLPAEDFLDEYRQKSFVLGKTVSFSQAGTDYDGTAIAINERGELIVQLSDGSEKVLSSGEISLQSIK